MCCYTSKGQQYQITFKVNAGNSTISGYGGILTIGFAINTSTVAIANTKCEWEYVDNSITLNNFALIWSENSDSSLTVELWVKITSAYLTYNFDVLSEQAGRTTRGTNVWTLYNTKTNGSVENPIVDSTKVLYSTIKTIKNPILAASSTEAGMVTTGTQSFAGAKTFTGAVTMNSTVRAANNGRMVSVQSSAPSDTGMLWAW